MLILLRMKFYCWRKTIVEIKESRWSWKSYKQNFNIEDKESCYDNPELIKHPYTTKPFVQHVLKKKTKKNSLNAKSVETISLHWINFLNILWMIVKTNRRFIVSCIQDIFHYLAFLRISISFISYLAYNLHMTQYKLAYESESQNCATFTTCIWFLNLFVFQIFSTSSTASFNCCFRVLKTFQKLIWLKKFSLCFFNSKN